MRNGAIGLILAAALASFAGCVSRGPSPELLTALDSRSDCGTRFRAAEKISYVPDRDMAYSQIALSAVDCRNDQVLAGSINRISDPMLRDDAAYRCAVALAQAGRGGEAGTVANAISAADLRTRALLEINRTAPEQKDQPPH